MNFDQWKKALRARLSAMPEDETDAILEYYKEMYADMADSGKSEGEIIAEFGTPEECALRALEDGEYAEKSTHTPDTVSNFSGKSEKKRRSFSVGEAVGVFFFSLIITLPLIGAALGVILSLASVSISGIVISLGGGIILIASPIWLFAGFGTGEILMLLGGAVTMIGAGGLIAIGFLYATKYSATGVLYCIRLIYRRN